MGVADWNRHRPFFQLLLGKPVRRAGASDPRAATLWLSRREIDLLGGDKRVLPDSLPR